MKPLKQLAFCLVLLFALIFVFSVVGERGREERENEKATPIFTSNNLFNSNTNSLYSSQDIARATSTPSDTGEEEVSGELVAPSFTLSDMAFTYDGLSHTLAVEDLYHPNMDEGYFTFVWYKDGEVLPTSSSSVVIKNTKDSGEYSVLVTFVREGESASKTSDTVLVDISPFSVSLPTLKSKVYDGSHLYATVPNSPYYTVTSNAGGTHAGAYSVTLTLTDSENTVWENTADTEPKEVPFVIEMAQNEWIEESFVLDSYLGCMPDFGGYGKFGTPTLTFSKNIDGPYSLVLPGSAGRYYAKVIVEATSDYTALIGPACEIEIRENRPSAIRIDTMPDKVIYTAFDSVSLDGIVVSATYLDGSVVVVDSRALRIIYDTYPAHLGGVDTGVTIAFGDTKTRLPLTVRRATYDTSAFSFDNQKETYTGAHLAISPTGTLPSGLDGVPLRYQINGGGTNVGTYEVRLSFLSDSENYECPADMTATLTIIPKTVELNWEMLTFVYDGSEKVPKASFINVWGKEEYAKVDGAKTLAREGYVATASEESGNYIFENASATFDIQKGNYNLDDVRWSASSFTFDNTAKVVTLLGLPSGVRVESYAQNSATDAGEYTASAVLSYDKENYNEPTISPLVWRIEKATYDLSGVEVLGGVFVYDKSVHYPTVLGSLPTGLDGISLTVSFSGGVSNVCEGRREIVVTFQTASMNYHTPAPVSVFITLTPAPVRVSWQSLSFTYDGLSHAPSASYLDIPISVSGSGVSAGEYIATATSLDENYYVSNPKTSYVIQKAKNTWVVSPAISDCFTSGMPSPEASATFGEVVFSYFDKNKQPINNPAGKAGEYICVASVAESENYIALSSGEMFFSINEVKPSHLVASLSGETFVAYQTLSQKDIRVFLVYNDGTKEEIKDYTLTYENGSSLRYLDQGVTVVWGDFTLHVPLTIKRATLRAEDVTFSLGTVTYTGTPFTLTVLDVPEGVELLSLSQDTFTAAGSYTVEAHFLLDSENYEGNGILTHTVNVEKKVIPTPAFTPLYYQAQLVSPPLLPSEDYEIISVTSASTPGVYPIVLKLKDSMNTTFANHTEEEITLYYTIEKAPITIKVSDITEYRDGTQTPFSYEIVSGTLYSGDTLQITPDIGEVVRAKVDAPNYEVSVIEGKFIQSSSHSPAFEERALVALALVVLVFLLILLLVYRGRKIHAYILSHTKKKRREATTHTPTETSSIPESEEIGGEIPGQFRVDVDEDADERNGESHDEENSENVCEEFDTPPLQETRDVTAEEMEVAVSTDSVTVTEVTTLTEEVTSTIEDATPAVEDATPSGECPMLSCVEEDGETREERTGSAEPIRSSIPEPEHRIDAEGGAVSVLQQTPKAPACTLVPDKKKTKRKKRTVKEKKEKKEKKTSFLELFFAPWHRNGGRHAERTVAHSTTDQGEFSSQGESPTLEQYFGITEEEADRLLSDRSAEALLEYRTSPIVTYGRRRAIINLDTLAEHFASGERIDIEILKARSLIPHDTLHLKVLARGTLSKPLYVFANEFSLSAVKMLLLTGGKAVRQKTKSVGLSGISRTKRREKTR